MGRRTFAIAGIAVISAGLTGLIIFAHWEYPSCRKSIEFTTATIVAVFVILGALYARASLRAAGLQARRNRSLQIIDDLNQYDSLEKRVELRKKLEDLPKDKLADEIREDPTDYLRAMHLLGIFEDIALAVRWNAADEWILYDSLCYMVPYYYRLLKPLISSIRKKAGDKRLYERLEHLADCWEKNKSARTSKPLKEPSS